MASSSAASNSKLQQRRKSNDTTCSSNSCCFLQKRKQIHPLAASLHTYLPRSTPANAVKQRVSSARMLKIRSLQSQLNDANFHLSELQQENKALKTLQNRQGRALSKYEGESADLPRLLQRHEEEMKVLTTKNRALRKSVKDVSDQLKTKEDELLTVREQLKSLTSLSKQKNLGERQMLLEQTEELKEKLRKSDEQVNLLTRKIQLETKNYRHRLNLEMAKNKQLQKDLLQALGEIDKSTFSNEVMNNRPIIPANRKRFANTSNHSRLIRQSDEKLTKELVKPKQAEEVNTEHYPKVSFSINNEVIFPNESENGNYGFKEISEKDVESNDGLAEQDRKTCKQLRNSCIIVSPTENIKARLSTSFNSINDDMVELDRTLDTMNLAHKENSFLKKTHSLDKPGTSFSATTATPLRNMPVQNEQEFIQRFGNLRSDLLLSVKECSNVVQQHMDDYQNAKTGTEKLMHCLRETDSLHAELEHSQLLKVNTVDIPENDRELANEIWREEYNFRKSAMNYDKNSGRIESDRNGNIVKNDEAEVGFEEKARLLAMLRAIDNGDDVEEITYSSTISSQKNRVVKELFADLHK